MKVDYLAGLYSRMRKWVIPHNSFIDELTLEQRKELSFVFICIDKGILSLFTLDKSSGATPCSDFVKSIPVTLSHENEYVGWLKLGLLLGQGHQLRRGLFAFRNYIYFELTAGDTRLSKQ